VAAAATHNAFSRPAHLTQTIEGLVGLYTVTKDERYLHLAQEVADRTEYYPGQHSHGFLTSVRGILNLATATGDSRYTEKAERLWAEVVNSDNLMIQGAVPESFQPWKSRTEGCSEADWLRLSLERTAVEPAFADRGSGNFAFSGAAFASRLR
jgi:DUF1680 family protein